METLEGLLRFFGSYPTWARALAGIGLAITVFTLLLAPRNTADAVSKDKPLANKEGGVWLIIEGVELFRFAQEAQFKVHITVNGTRFVYPTLEGVEWLGVGSTMAAQQFPLPRPGRNGYEIQMRMDMREFDEMHDFRSVRRVFVKKIPFEGEYELHSVTGGVRAPGIDAVVRFRVGNDPNG